jgi:dephospho-CoA kinase
MRSLRIGITGGIGSGKSMVCKIFALLGAPIYDADSRARKLMTEDEVLIDQIKKKFGTRSYHIDGSLNREFLSEEVFNDSEKLEEMNKLVHPRVALDSERWMTDHANVPYVIKEAALLFESGAYKALDKIIVVAAPESLRLKRVINRDKTKTKEEVKKIIQSQMPEDEKKGRADFVINNDETDLVIPQILKLHERFINHPDK